MSVTTVECVVGGDLYVPAIVSVKLPVGVDAVVLTVRVELWPARIEDGANVPLAPEGSPFTERLTVFGVPLETCVVTEYVTLFPRTTDCVVGVAVIAKSLP